MLIKALCDYYENKLSKNISADIPKGFKSQNVHYRIMLKPNGEISSIVPWQSEEIIKDKKGKEKVTLKPREIYLPERLQTTKVAPNTVEHRPLYIFGLNLEKDGFTPFDKTKKAVLSHNSLVEHELGFFEDLNSDICTAYKNFLKNWVPENETENPHLLELGNKYKTANFCFGLEGGNANLEEDEELIAKCVNSLGKDESEKYDESRAMCGIFGEQLPIAELHTKIKFPDIGMGGAPLVSMKEKAYHSYGKVKSFNSNVSQKAMKEYTEALNDLLKSKNHHVKLDDLVIVYFSTEKADEECSSLFSAFFQDNSESTQDSLNQIAEYIKNGVVGDIPQSNAEFYVFGMSANSARICLKFAYKNKFGKILENLIQHQLDLKINPQSEKQIQFWQMKKELISPNSTNEKVSPALMSSIMMSALSGARYPKTLLENVLRRIKLDSATETNKFIKFNDTRVGIVKACLNREARILNNKEEFGLAYDYENTNQAYICGGLFAIFEMAQRAALGDINRTVTDSYYSQAMSRPISVMPKLERLSQNHMKVLKRDKPALGIRYDKVKDRLMCNIEGNFPKVNNLEQQGSFVLGYYQMKSELFSKNTNTYEN